MCYCFEVYCCFEACLHVCVVEVTQKISTTVLRVEKAAPPLIPY